MKSLLQHKAHGLLALAFVGLVMLGNPGNANAQWGYGGYGYGGYSSGPVYHAPSLHYDSVYHPTRTHWTPWGGLHTHGHRDVVPHYTPGHIDYQHRGHVHGNPAFHH